MASERGRYPVINPNPTVDDCFNAVRVGDYVQLVGITGATWAFGFIRGKPARFAMAGFTATIGVTFGCMVILQNTRNRFLGVIENSQEVKKYGAYVPDPDKPDDVFGEFYR